MSRLTAAAALFAAVAAATAASAADKLVLQLHAPAQFEFAGYYAALWQGYYQAAGLTVEIKPGKPRRRAALPPPNPGARVGREKPRSPPATATSACRTRRGRPPTPR